MVVTLHGSISTRTRPTRATRLRVLDGIALGATVYGSMPVLVATAHVSPLTGSRTTGVERLPLVTGYGTTTPRGH